MSRRGPEPAEAAFGDRNVPAADKAGLVRQVFERVAPRYDLMNDLMSFGVHRLWKDVMVDVLAPRAGEDLLDVAGGTGDIAFRLQRRTAGAARIIVCDVNRAMLEVGRDRAIDRGLLQSLHWLAADAERLPFPNASFDAYSIAFGLRNVTHPEAALAEARRVLRPGGRLVCLEFSRMLWPGVREIYDAWSARALPFLGRFVAGDAESYRYLHDSIRRFPHQEALADMMRATGLGNVTWRNLTGGAVALHCAWRI